MRIKLPQNPTFDRPSTSDKKNLKNSLKIRKMLPPEIIEHIFSQWSSSFLVEKGQWIESENFWFNQCLNRFKCSKLIGKKWKKRLNFYTWSGGLSNQ